MAFWADTNPNEPNARLKTNDRYGLKRNRVPSQRMAAPFDNIRLDIDVYTNAKTTKKNRKVNVEKKEKKVNAEKNPKATAKTKSKRKPELTTLLSLPSFSPPIANIRRNINVFPSLIDNGNRDSFSDKIKWAALVNDFMEWKNDPVVKERLCQNAEHHAEQLAIDVLSSLRLQNIYYVSTKY